MAEVNAKDLTTKTTPASTDSMLLFGTTTNEGAKITVDNLAENILGRLSTKTFPNQVGGSSAATILAQLATLNTNTKSPTYTSQSSLYSDTLALSGYHQSRFIIIDGTLANILSKGNINTASRGFANKADNTTVDVFFASYASGKICMTRITDGTTAPSLAHIYSSTS